jgi:hypothetical protein
MKVNFGLIVTAGSGSAGGQTIQKGKTGHCLKNKSIPRQPVSNYSAIRRSSFTSISKLWKTLLVAVVATWNNAAKNIKLSGNYGLPYSPSGFQLFSTLNNNLAAIDVVPISAVPAAASVGTMTTLSIAVAAGAQTLTITYAPAVPATAAFVIEATNGISQTRQVRDSDFRRIGKLLTANASPYSAEALYILKFGVIPAAGTIVHLRVRPVHLTAGWGGQPFSCSAVVAA